MKLSDINNMSHGSDCIQNKFFVWFLKIQPSNGIIDWVENKPVNRKIMDYWLELYGGMISNSVWLLPMAFISFFENHALDVLLFRISNEVVTALDKQLLYKSFMDPFIYLLLNELFLNE